jgi:hypothetical protein
LFIISMERLCLGSVRDLLGFGAFSCPASKNDLCDCREESILAFFQANAPKARVMRMRCHSVGCGMLGLMAPADAVICVFRGKVSA